MAKTAYIGLGSNLGDSLRVLQEAWQAIGRKTAIELEDISSPYRTEPVGMDSRHWFINAAGSLKTSLEPEELLQTLLIVEKDFGRTRESRSREYRDRILDLDLLLYENRVINRSDLVLPHPEIENRLFVLYPLCEIAPHCLHPRLGRTVRELLRVLKNKPKPPAVHKMTWTDFR